ncbi:MAG: FeoB-associated Cys-rich membrane protein [Clostridia bacterium]|nr:FeoB-associated Cys-rich membrane protein [Clostridia bacterium]
MGDLIVILILALICGLAIFSLVRRKKRGSSCSCGCSSCPRQNCPSKQKNPEE